MLGNTCSKPEVGSPAASATQVRCPVWEGCGGVSDCLLCRWYAGTYGTARLTSVRCELDRAHRRGAVVQEVPGRFLG